MEIDFWLNAWTEGKTRFHQSAYNPNMKEFFKNKDLTDRRVFIPMAGKTLDINYFLNKGANVTAVECSSKAIMDFFKDNNMQYELTEQGDYLVYKSGNLTYLQGDYFTLSKKELPIIDYIYDRASIVALPYKMRVKYVQKMGELVREQQTRLCIITFECDLEVNMGPPFMIPAAEIEELYANSGINLSKKIVGTGPVPPHYREEGVTEMYRVLWSNKL